MRDHARMKARALKREREMQELAETRAAIEKDLVEKKKKLALLKIRQEKDRKEWDERLRQKALAKKRDMEEDVRLAKEWTAMMNKREQDRKDAYARVYEKQRLRQQQFEETSGAEEKAKAEAEAAKIALWLKRADEEAERKEREKRERREREKNERLATLARQLKEKEDRAARLKEEDRKYGELYVEEAKKAIEDKKQKLLELKMKNQKYQAELMAHSELVRMEKEKKSVSMTNLERSLNKESLKVILSSPKLFERLKKKVEKAGA